jgi:hypothetical protein
VVNRPAFEARLHAHYEQSGAFDDEPAWYALRNTVFASGCRLEMSKAEYGISFAEAQSHAWRYFENALSVHTELLYSQTSILAVEALCAMVSSPLIPNCPADLCDVTSELFRGGTREPGS